MRLERTRREVPVVIFAVLTTLVCSTHAIIFTGNVPADFPPTDPTVLLVTTPGPVLMGPTGWQLYDMRWAYDSSTDTAYFGKYPCADLWLHDS